MKTGTSKILCGVCVLLAFNCKSQTSIGHGSLVVVTPSKQGLVIVADKRLTLTETKEELFKSNQFDQGKKTTSYKSINKIDSLNRYYGFSVCGNRTLTQKGKVFFDIPMETETFNAVKIVQTYFENNPVIIDDEKVLSVIGSELRSEWLKIYKPDPNEFLNPNSPPELLLSVIFYGYDVRSRRYNISALHLLKVKIPYNTNGISDGISSLNSSIPSLFTYKKTEIGFMLEIIPSDSLKLSKHFSIGETDLDNELKVGTNSQYDSIRHLDVMRHFLPNAKKLVKKQEVISFSKCLVKQTSLLKKTVSENVDVAIINKKGFKILEKNSK